MAKEGDANTRLFYKVVNGKRRRSYIKELETEIGEKVTKEGRICAQINLLIEEDRNRLRSDLTQLQHWLERPFEETKIKDAVFVMDREKAPGPRWIHYEIFQECWDIIKKDIFVVFTDFHRKGVMCKSMK